MAIWQFKVEIIPDAEAGQRELIPDDEWEQAGWWLNSPPPDEFLEELACLLPSHKSWSDDLSQWGDQQSDLVEVWREGAKVESISARIDTRALNSEFVKALLEIANKWNCRLVYARYRKALPRDYMNLEKALLESPNFKVMRDPEMWLPKMAAEVESDSVRVTKSAPEDL